MHTQFPAKEFLPYCDPQGRNQDRRRNEEVGKEKERGLDASKEQILMKSMAPELLPGSGLYTSGFFRAGTE